MNDMNIVKCNEDNQHLDISQACPSHAQTRLTAQESSAECQYSISCRQRPDGWNEARKILAAGSRKSEIVGLLLLSRSAGT